MSEYFGGGIKCNYLMTPDVVEVPSRQGDEKHACSPDLPRRVVNCDKRWGSLIHSLSKEPDCNDLR